MRNSNEIILCVNCDSEFTVTQIDDDDHDVEFCPFCGYDMAAYEDEDDLEIDDEDKTYQ